jgi:hypothetical protein
MEIRGGGREPCDKKTTKIVGTKANRTRGVEPRTASDFATCTMTSSRPAVFRTPCPIVYSTAVLVGMGVFNYK